MSSIKPRTIRRIATENKEIFLTFDDGPNNETTPIILDVLKENGINATFFLVANKIVEAPLIVRRLIKEGHSIGNHSLDHKYKAFFSGKSYMKYWIEKSEEVLQDYGVTSSVGFRPPVGIHTPELHWALNQLEMPLILWNVRFYDAVFSWTQARAIKSLKNIVPGSILLLHDSRSMRSLMPFTKTLQSFILEALSMEYQFKVLTRSLCMSQYIQK